VRSSGTREISLEGDAQGVLLTASADLATRRSGDGRQPVDNCTEFFDMGVHQVRAANGASSAPTFGPTRPTPAAADEPTLSGVLLAAVARGLGEHELDALARRVLQSALEQRQVRLTRTGAGWPPTSLIRSRPHGVSLLDVDLTGDGGVRRASPEPLPS
jgi:hypothetical protein